MIDPTRLSENELATCVDELIVRTMTSLRNAGCDKNIMLMIYASQWNKESEYKIVHKAEVNSKHTMEGNNLFKSAQTAATHWMESLIDEPKTIRPLLAAPTTDSSVAEFAEFEPVTEEGDEDGIPF